MRHAALDIHVLLGPTVNVQRSPLGGRGFEMFSEDPTLNGTIAGAYISGLQSQGVGACIKHFVANEQEFQRFVLYTRRMRFGIDLNTHAGSLLAAKCQREH